MNVAVRFQTSGSTTQFGTAYYRTSYMRDAGAVGEEEGAWMTYESVSAPPFLCDIYPL